MIRNINNVIKSDFPGASGKVAKASGSRFAAFFFVQNKKYKQNLNIYTSQLFTD